jgi:hypothetical protein
LTSWYAEKWVCGGGGVSVVRSFIRSFILWRAALLQDHDDANLPGYYTMIRCVLPVATTTTYSIWWLLAPFGT